MIKISEAPESEYGKEKGGGLPLLVGTSSGRLLKPDVRPQGFAQDFDREFLSDEDSSERSFDSAKHSHDMTHSASVVELGAFDGGFEGPEKKLEIDFKLRIGETEAGEPLFSFSPMPARKVDGKVKTGLRSIPREEWDRVCTLANCKILSVLDTDYCTAFLLSESSLFVYPQKIMMKTCGTTTLLKAVPPILEFARNLKLEVEFIMYGRNRFKWPDRQQFPHRSFNDEVRWLQQRGFDGHAYVLGQLLGQHFFIFLDDYSKGKPLIEYNDQTLEMIMFDLDPEAMANFFQRQDEDNGIEHARRLQRWNEIFPGSEIDDYLFKPCGYSLNGMIGPAYFTVHVTPENGQSYVSFETNVARSSYSELINHVVSTFRPGRFSVVFLSDISAMSGPSSSKGFDPHIPAYHRVEKTLYEFFGGYDVTYCNYVKDKDKVSANARPMAAKVGPRANKQFA